MALCQSPECRFGFIRRCMKRLTGWRWMNRFASSGTHKADLMYFVLALWKSVQVIPRIDFALGFFSPDSQSSNLFCSTTQSMTNETLSHASSGAKVKVIHKDNRSWIMAKQQCHYAPWMLLIRQKTSVEMIEVPHLICTSIPSKAFLCDRTQIAETE